MFCALICSAKMGVSLCFWFGLHGRQPLQDAARLHGLLAMTSLAQGGQLQLEVGEFPYALIDMGDVLIKNLIHRAAALLGPVSQTQQGVDFVVAHVKRTAIADEAQALDVLGPIHAEVASRAAKIG